MQSNQQTYPHSSMTWDGSYPTLIIVRGLPGGGKTFLAAELRKVLGSTKTVVLDPDAIDFESQEYLAHTKALTEEGVDLKLHAYRFLRAAAYRGIENHKLIIWNQPFTNLEIFHKMIGRLRDHAAENDVPLALLVVEVETDPAISSARIELRKQAGGHGPSADTFSRFVRDYHSFASQGYTTVTVRGEGDVQLSAMTVMRALHDLWQQQQTPSSS